MVVFQLKQLIISDGFKFNSALCVLDFLMRHGQILPDEGLTLSITINTVEILILLTCCYD